MRKMSFDQVQIRVKKRKHSPEILKIIDKRICDEPVHIPIYDQEMRDIDISLRHCVIIDDYTEDELIEYFPLWMKPPVVNIDNLLF